MFFPRAKIYFLLEFREEWLKRDQRHKLVFLWAVEDQPFTFRNLFKLNNHPKFSNLKKLLLHRQCLKSAALKSRLSVSGTNRQNGGSSRESSLFSRQPILPRVHCDMPIACLTSLIQRILLLLLQKSRKIPKSPTKDM